MNTYAWRLLLNARAVGDRNSEKKPSQRVFWEIFIQPVLSRGRVWAESSGGAELGYLDHTRIQRVP